MNLLAILALPMLLFSQLAVAHPSSELSLRDLEELYELLSVDKRQGPRREKLTKENSKEVCSQTLVELGLIIDSSVSISVDNYTKGLEFLANVLGDYKIGPDQVRVAAVSFGKGVYMDNGFNLTEYDNAKDVKAAVLGMPHRQGTRTDTGLALKHMREVQMSGMYTRPGVPKIVLVLTDGNSQQRYYTKYEADETKKANITVFALGVGKDVQYRELKNIAGGVDENVIQAESYDKLNDQVKAKLKTKTCVLVPIPTTTPPPTTTMQAIEQCGKDYPTDINFVFSPSALGLEKTREATRFIHRVLEHEKMTEGVQYGLVTGDCPIDEGFTLKEYHKVNVDERLRGYDYSKLPKLVSNTTRERFSPSSGGQKDAKKVAVIFVGSSMKDMSELRSQIVGMVESGVKVYISTPDWNVRNNLATGEMPSQVVFLEPTKSPMEQAVDMVNDLCEPVMMAG